MMKYNMPMNRKRHEKIKRHTDRSAQKAQQKKKGTTKTLKNQPAWQSRVLHRETKTQVSFKQLKCQQ